MGEFLGGQGGVECKGLGLLKVLKKNEKLGWDDLGKGGSRRLNRNISASDVR